MSRKALKLYIIVASLILFGLAMDAFIMPWLVHSRSVISIPDVVGKPTNVAQQILNARGLNPSIAGTAPSKTVKPGCVIFQDPVASSVVREGRNVYLTVSGGEEFVEMPNLRGRSLRDAKITLEQLDLRLGSVTFTASEMPQETVISQTVMTRKQVAKGTTVNIDVSSGPLETLLEVPYLTGLSLDEAQRRLRENGLRVGQILYRESSELLPNTVVAQAPEAGEKAPSNSPVDLTVVH